MSALAKQPQTAPTSDVYPAMLVDPARFADLAEMFSAHMDITSNALDDVEAFDGVDLVIIELNQAGAIERLEAIARFAPETRVLVIGDALPAPAVRAMLRLQTSDLAAASAGATDIVGAAGRLVQAASDRTARPNQCWVVTGAVGGAGATTISIELACAAAQEEGNTVCIIDLNLADGMIASYLEGEPKLDLVGLSAAPERLDPTLLSAYGWDHGSGVNLIAASRNPDINEFVSSDLVLRLLDTVCTVYTHVIVDMPRTRQSWSKPILSGADQVLVISEFTVPSLHAAADMSREIDALRQDAEPTKLVLNRMSDAKSEFSVSRASKAIEREIGAVVRSDWKSARAAVNLGMPIQTVKPKSKLVKDIMTLKKQIEAEPTDARAKSAGR